MRLRPGLRLTMCVDCDRTVVDNCPIEKSGCRPVRLRLYVSPLLEAQSLPANSAASTRTTA